MRRLMTEWLLNTVTGHWCYIFIPGTVLWCIKLSFVWLWRNFWLLEPVKIYNLGINGKFVLVLSIFIFQTVFEEWMELTNWGIAVVRILLTCTYDWVFSWTVGVEGRMSKDTSKGTGFALYQTHIFHHFLPCGQPLVWLGFMQLVVEEEVTSNMDLIK